MPYHLNPTTGVPGRCRAQLRCPFGIPLDAHFPREEDARSAFEASMEDHTFPPPLTAGRSGGSFGGLPIPAFALSSRSYPAHLTLSKMDDEELLLPSLLKTRGSTYASWGDPLGEGEERWRAGFATASPQERQVMAQLVGDHLYARLKADAGVRQKEKLAASFYKGSTPELTKSAVVQAVHRERLRVLASIIPMGEDPDFPLQVEDPDGLLEHPRFSRAFEAAKASLPTSFFAMANSVNKPLTLGVKDFRKRGEYSSFSGELNVRKRWLREAPARMASDSLKERYFDEAQVREMSSTLTHELTHRVEQGEPSLNALTMGHLQVRIEHTDGRVDPPHGVIMRPYEGKQLVAKRQDPDHLASPYGGIRSLNPDGTFRTSETLTTGIQRLLWGRDGSFNPEAPSDVLLERHVLASMWFYS